jgi:hypothetical protein
MTQNLPVPHQPRPMISAEQVNPISMMFDPTISERLLVIAQTMAKGTVTMPEHLRGKVGDCLAIAMQAASWQLNPFAVAQKTHLVNGTLGYEAQLVNAIVISLGLLEGRFSYDYIGDWARVAKPPKIEKVTKPSKYENGKPYITEVIKPGWSESDEEGLGVRITGKLRGDPTPRDVTVWLASCYPRNSQLWSIDPAQQISYVAVKRWTRRYAPDAILGVYTVDEIDHEPRLVQGERVDVAPIQSENGALAYVSGAAAASQIVTKAEAKAPDDMRPPEGVAIKDKEPATEWPKADPETGELLDAQGCPWLEEVHSQNKTCNADGYWRRKKGVMPSAAREAEERAMAPESEQDEKDSAPSHESKSWTSPSARMTTWQIQLNAHMRDGDAEAIEGTIVEICEDHELTQDQREKLIDSATAMLDSL